MVIDVTAEAIGERIRTQDSRLTKDPIFIVQQRRRFYGVDDGYADSWIWLHEDDWCEATPEQHDRLEDEYEATLDEPTGWCRVGFVDTWEFVTACFTEAAAQHYIDIMRHRLRHPRIYVESAYRNDEWNAVRMMLRQAAIRRKLETIKTEV